MPLHGCLLKARVQPTFFKSIILKPPLFTLLCYEKWSDGST